MRPENPPNIVLTVDTDETDQRLELLHKKSANTVPCQTQSPWRPRFDGIIRSRLLTENHLVSRIGWAYRAMRMGKVALSSIDLVTPPKMRSRSLE
jgi:hypothetical protein